VAKKLIQRIFGSEDADDEDDDLRGVALDETGDGQRLVTARPRSLADSWDRLAAHNRAIEQRFDTLDKVQQELLGVTKDLLEQSRRQVQFLEYLGKLNEAAEKRGRQMEHSFQGVPDVLRTLPSATREQAEKLSEIAARLYERAQDNTVNALKSAQANHQRAIEDLIDRSLDQSRRLTWWAMTLTALSLAAALFIYLESVGV